MATSDPVEVAVEIVAAFVSNNSVSMSEVPHLIESVHAALTVSAGLNSGSASVVKLREPAVSIRKSVTPDYLICLDDGKRYKSLRRHLASLGMTPDQYRAKWSLPLDYPMVAPAYTSMRSEMAKSYGFGESARELSPLPRRPPLNARSVAHANRPRNELPIRVGAFILASALFVNDNNLYHTVNLRVCGRKAVRSSGLGMKGIHLA